jgi:hypothetical protein
MNAYVGVYSHAPQQWEVFLKDGRLYLKREGVESKLKKVGPRALAYDGAGEDPVVFAPGANGKIERLFMGLYSARKIR